MAAKRLPASTTSEKLMIEDVDESANQEVTPDPDVEAIPSLTVVAPTYDGLLEMAARRLDGPVQTRIQTWENGEFEIRVYHGYGPHPQRPDTAYQHVLRYHSRDGDVVEALVAVGVATSEKTLIYRTAIDTDGVCVDAGRIPEEN